MYDHIKSANEVVISPIASLPSCCALTVADEGQDCFREPISELASVAVMELILHFPQLTLVITDPASDRVVEGPRKEEGAFNDTDE